MSGLGNFLLAIMMLGVFALVAGGLFGWRHNRRRALLMFAAAAVLLGNVLIIAY